ncbi:MAG: UDP-N-acetylglucosamine--N-acetylmuramyl-(pentapeptide) pyrophosphoryl-undecaprenol N-acetylglucosamine transferase [Phycisphaerales bacterium]|nr:UDP-N-acetylglucosamine--N-acetylmuramyl-(pentapeptide) pyrophosphoryl-undecaprenol N-acetylglucosamine transferase [Phycisphaerales bacterium]
MPSERPKRLVLAGGGTGGHISPGLAIAERLRLLQPDTRVVFACSTRAIDTRMLVEAAQMHVAIPAEPPAIRPRALLRFLRSVLPARASCRALVRVETPDWVVALGGFVSVPMVMAARSARVRVALVNIDATPGRANRMVAPRSDLVFSSMPVKGLGGVQQEIVGTPIRLGAIGRGDPQQSRAALGLDPDARTLLVTGASQGASSINDLATALAGQHARDLEGWQVLHLAGGTADCETLRAAYQRAGVGARVIPFLHQMGEAWDAADIALSRAGANSVAEAAYNSVPTIFLPYPWHKDQHQRLNAQPLVDSGGALVCTDHLCSRANLEDAGALLLRMVRDRSHLASMREALVRLPRIDAAQIIAQRLLAG